MREGLPAGLDDFLAEAGWGGAQVEPLPGDASFRRYFRIRTTDETARARTAMLMDAPPPHEDPGPFLHVGKWLCAHDMRAPAIYAERPEQGLVLIEDFGADRMRDWLDDNPDAEAAVYGRAIDALVALHRCPPGPFAPYDMAVYQREAPEFEYSNILVMNLEMEDGRLYAKAENIMLLPDGGQGLIDFQDALVGHPAYDLVSLLQDARRDVSPELERAMLDRYLSQVDAGPEFEADYARLGAQRNAKIVGIFARLWKRDGKPRYLAMIPRVWDAMERDLKDSALAPVAAWFEANVPRELRDTGGGELQ